MLKVFLFSSLCAACPADLTAHDFIIRILFLDFILPANLDSKGFSHSLLLLLLFLPLLLLLEVTPILIKALRIAGETNKLENIHTADQFLSVISLVF
jgi:hypothetical protein